MDKLNFSVKINSSRENIWHILWDDETYRDWTSVFAEGSYAKSDWKEGSRIEFLTPDGSGMFSEIAKLVPSEFMSFKHHGEIKDGKEIPFPGDNDMFENYSLREDGGVTTLHVEMDIPKEYKGMFEGMFPKALNRVKELAEK